MSNAEAALVAWMDKVGVEGDARDVLIQLLHAAETGVAEIVSPRGIVASVEQIWDFDLEKRLEDIRSGKEGPVSDNVAIATGSARSVIQDVMSERGASAVRQIVSAISDIEKLDD